MKKTFALVWSIALLNLFFINQAQAQDTALARIDDSNRVDVTTDPEKMDEAKSSKKEEVKETTENAATSAAFKLPRSVTDKDSKASSLDGKVGPNGEELIKKKNKYYYIDAKGKKVKAKKSDLKDKPKYS